jgi:hypothetical protein
MVEVLWQCRQATCGKLLGLLLTWSTGQHLIGRSEVSWPDIHWLARDKDALVAARLESLSGLSWVESAVGARIGPFWA